jgi:hypothetical protein
MAGLSPIHRNRIVQSFLAIHRQLTELEASLVMAGAGNAFSERTNDLAPAEAGAVRDHFARVRAAMYAHLQELNIPLEKLQTSLRWVLETSLMHLAVVLDDFNPRSMSGYGAVDEIASAKIQRIQQDIGRMIQEVQDFLRKESGHDLARRLSRLEAEHVDAGLLSLLHNIVLRWHLVEFNQPIDQITRRIESPSFEIAFFGRVVALESVDRH